MITGMIFAVATAVAIGSIPSRVLDVGNLDYFKFTVNQAATYLTDTSGNTDWYDLIGQGGTGYRPAPGDYDGDGVTDIAVYGETNGYWYIKYSNGSGYGFDSLGGSGSVPVNMPYLFGLAF